VAFSSTFAPGLVSAISLTSNLSYPDTQPPQGWVEGSCIYNSGWGLNATSEDGNNINMGAISATGVNVDVGTEIVRCNYLSSGSVTPRVSVVLTDIADPNADPIATPETPISAQLGVCSDIQLPLCGDADNDGQLTAADPIIALRAAVGLSTAPCKPSQWPCGDSDGNLIVEIQDAAFSMYSILGMKKNESFCLNRP
jgi:hypothetical protein